MSTTDLAAGGVRAGPRPPAASRPELPDLPMTGGRNRALDGLRVIAAMAVLTTHVGGETGFSFTGTPLSWVIARCDIGVPIFFALSGLLLYGPWARAAINGTPGPRVATYFRRRALRILPAYWLVVVIAMLTLNTGHLRSALTWLQYLLLAQNYDPHPWWGGTGAPGLAQMWSLVVEVSFYLLLPLLAAGLTWLARRGRTPAGRAKRLLAGVGVLGLSSYAYCTLLYFPSLQLWLGELLPHLLTWFAAGMAMAVLAAWAHAEPDGDGPAARCCRTIASLPGSCWLIALLAFAIACTPLAGPETFAVPALWNTEIKTALYTVVALALVAPAAFQPGRATLVTRLLGNKVMSFLGQISYGIFLWQFLIIYGFFALTRVRDAFHGGYFAWPAVLGIWVLVAAVTVGVSALSYYLLELPAQDLGRTAARPASLPSDRTG